FGDVFGRHDIALGGTDAQVEIFGEPRLPLTMLVCKQPAALDQQLTNLDDIDGVAAQDPAHLHGDRIEFATLCLDCLLLFHINNLRSNAASASLTAFELSDLPIRNDMLSGAMKAKCLPRSYCQSGLSGLKALPRRASSKPRANSLLATMLRTVA